MYWVYCYALHIQNVVFDENETNLGTTCSGLVIPQGTLIWIKMAMGWFPFITTSHLGFFENVVTLVHLIT